jgi:heme exporter protein B
LAWIALFWVITLFASVNAIARSFMQYSASQMRYYYTVAPPTAIILSKIIYNALLNILLALLALVCFSVLIGNPIHDNYTFFIAICLGSTALSTTLTMMSAIAHKAGNNPTLMTILSLPAIIPTLSMTIKISKNALDGLQFVASYDEIIALFCINIIAIAVAYILFPYLWRV